MRNNKSSLPGLILNVLKSNVNHSCALEPASCFNTLPRPHLCKYPYIIEQDCKTSVYDLIV